MEKPWDIDTAFRQPEAIRPGDVLYLRGGVYTIRDRLNINSRLQGEQDRWITVRPWGTERVVIDGGIFVLGSWVTFRDLEIRNTSERRQTDIAGPFPADIPQPTGINVLAPNVRAINNVIRDAGNGMSSWTDAPDTEFYGNIVFNNGWVGPDRPHGHGMYLQNRVGHKLIEDNVVFNNFEYGVQIYGTSETYLNNFHVEGNVLFGNGGPGGSWSRNILLGGGTVANAPELIDNITYFPLTGDHGGDNNIGYYPGGQGCLDLVMEGNYFVSGGLALTLYNCPGLVKDNTIVGPVRAFDPASYSSDNSFQRQRPAKNRIFVRPNRYEPGRAHVVVFNWERAARVDVDLTPAGLASGDAFEIRDVQDLFAKPLVAGRYNGRSVQIPMTAKSVVEPYGNIRFHITHTDSEFGVFLVRKLSGAPAKFSAAVEAEDAARGETVLAESAEGASGGKAVRFTAGGGWLAFSTDVPETGLYSVWIRVRQETGAPSSFQLLGAGEVGEVAVDASDSAAPQWKWIHINERLEGGTGDRFLRLEAGSALIALTVTDENLRLDRFIVTSDLSFSPDQQL